MLLASHEGMATLVGTQKSLDELLHALLELEHDAILAYTVAIERLEDITAKHRLEQFRADHQQHVRMLEAALESRGKRPPYHGDLKAVLTQGKVVIGNLVGDRGILMAMHSNENDTNTAYERAVGRADLDSELHALFSEHLEDERRHRRWIQDQLETLGGAPRREPASEEYLGRKWG
ncbi:MAG: ferritin-like domain-containing protein [Pseudomonadota bacterium]|nr:MAG: rubrerythrin family protein [Pseudomonadota bacterium]